MASVFTLQYFNAAVQYRREHLSHIEATFLNRTIPFQLFVSFYPETILKNAARNKLLLKELITAAQLRYRSTMRYAVAFETFAFSAEVHCHVAIAADKELDPNWFQRYFPASRVNCKVLPYREALSYMMKQTNVELVNCDVYLKPPSNSRERRRARRMAVGISKVKVPNEPQEPKA